MTIFQTTLKKKLILLAIITTVVLFFWGSNMLQNEYWQLVSFFENYATARPILSILVFLTLTIISVMFLFFSSAWLVPIAVSVWGSFATVLLLLIGWLVGAIFSYILGRYAGFPVLKYFIPLQKLDYYRDLFSKNPSLLLVFLLRFIVPSEIPGYALGIFRLNFLKYLLITVLAEIPYAFVTVYAIGAILNKDPIVLSSIIFVWLLATMLMFRLLYKKFAISRIES